MLEQKFSCYWFNLIFFLVAALPNIFIVCVNYPHKISDFAFQEVNMKLVKYDELDALIKGMLYVETNNPCECYYWSEPTDDTLCKKVPYDFTNPYPFLVSTSCFTMAFITL